MLSGGTSHTPKIARLLQSIFPETTTVHAPSTSATAINPSELTVRGAAIQASLIQEFDTDDIEQSTHPAVTATPHLSRAIGVLVVSADESDPVFRPLLEAETAVPARRIVNFAAPKAGGDVIVKLCEGVREIKVTKPDPQAKATNGKKDDSDSDGDSDDEEQEIKQKAWKVGKMLAEVAVRGVGKGKKVEVMANVAGDLSVQFTAREVGGKGGVRGGIEKP
jgi:molecular chaperone DnaK (HSP70)